MTRDPLIGRQLANFRLDRVLGRGGMAQVYYGWDVKLERPVAVKVIDVRFRGEPAYARRFLREAQTVATWRHDNIAQVHYADQEGDLYYFAMEYVDGPDLGQVLSRYAAKGELIPQEDVLHIGRAIAGALDYAHRQGVIHRDVKPSNIIVARDGRVVLTDFGLALDVAQGSMGEVFGSAHYIAPEQARRSSDAVPQSDLYALAVILYELLTGIVPFDDPSPTTVALQHLTLRPPPPRAINPDLSAGTEAVLLKALSKSPAERYPTGDELMNALENAVRAGPATSARRPLPPIPAGVQPPAVRQSAAAAAEIVPSQLVRGQPAASRRNLLVPLILGGCVLLLTGAAMGAVLLRGEWRALWPQMTPSPQVAATPTPVVQAVIGDTVTLTPTPATGTALPRVATNTTAPTLVPSQPTNTDTPTTDPATAMAALPTVKYPDGRRFMLYYDNNSLYLLNLSTDLVSISSVAFERLDSTGARLNRFDGWRWAQFYPTSRPGGCMAIEILDSSPLRPSECGGIYHSTRTPAREDAVVFWTSQAGSLQFRVLWRGANRQDEEVARCEIPAQTCEVFLP